MARVSHKKVRQLLDEKRSKITDRQFFTSRILAGHFEDIAAVQIFYSWRGIFPKQQFFCGQGKDFLIPQNDSLFFF